MVTISDSHAGDSVSRRHRRWAGECRQHGVVVVASRRGFDPLLPGELELSGMGTVVSLQGGGQWEIARDGGQGSVWPPPGGDIHLWVDRTHPDALWTREGMMACRLNHGRDGVVLFKGGQHPLLLGRAEEHLMDWGQGGQGMARAEVDVSHLPGLGEVQRPSSEQEVAGMGRAGVALLPYRRDGDHQGPQPTLRGVVHPPGPAGAKATPLANGAESLPRLSLSAPLPPKKKRKKLSGQYQ